MSSRILFALTLSTSVFAQQAPMAVYPGPAAKSPVKQMKVLPPGSALAGQRPAPYRLPSLSESEAQRRSDRQIGVRRAAPAEALGGATVVTLPDGRRLWRATLASPAAAGLRVHFQSFAAGRGQVWVYRTTQPDQAVESEGPYTGRGPFDDGDFWTGAVPGDTVTIEYAEAKGEAGALPPFEIDAIVHLWDASAGPDTPPQAAYCHLDVSCYSDYQQMAAGVVRLWYVGDDGSAYVCTGSMINTRNSNFKPYLLTAHHCLGSDSEARSLQAYFSYQTPSCNGTPPATSEVPKITGARYLAGGGIGVGDYALVLLSQDVPPGTTFLGWSTGGFDLGDAALGIHHPAGSWKRISFGNRSADQPVRIGDEIAPSNLYYRVSWTQGKTEGGSSGSPLLNRQGQILGTLTSGPHLDPGQSVCDVDPEISGYGRFSNAYPAIRDYLEDTPPPSLDVNPTNLVFNVTNGQYSGPSQQTFTIRTGGGASLSYSLAASAPWIKLSNLSGTVSSSAPATVTVTLDLSSFSRSANVTGSISASAGTLTPITVWVQANVTVSQSNVTVAVAPNPVYQQAADSEGYAWFYTVTLNETGGVATQVTGFKIAGSDYSGSIVGFFGSDQLPAGGKLSARIRSRNLTVPVNRVFQASGVDAGTTRAWTAQTTVSFLGPLTHAVLSMDSAPELVRQNPGSANCPWMQQLVLQETGGWNVTLDKFIAGGHDLSDRIASFWGNTQLTANGSLRTGLCWTGLAPPVTIEITVSGTDSNGAAVSATTRGSFTGPAVDPTTLAASPGSVLLNAPAGSSSIVSRALSLNLGSGSANWTGRLIFPKPQTGWLVVSPLSGSGSATLGITASPGGLAQGSYEATLVLQSLDALPALVNIPIKLMVGASGAGPVIDPAGIVHNTTYLPAAAPGMVLSVFGQRLAVGTEQASSLPLPLSMQGVNATVNGRPAPLYFVSPNQLNLQVPYETEIGTATLTVTVNGQSASQPFQVSATAPGIFTSDGRNVVPSNQASRGGDLVLFLTGQGALNPAMATGAAPSLGTPLKNLPAPVAPVMVTVGGVPAQIVFSGIPYYLVGVMQLNCVIPRTAPAGIQPVVVRIGDKLSPAAYVFVN